MKTSSVYKSEEGKQKILAHYKKLLGNLTIDYNEKYVNTSYGKTYLLEAGNNDSPAIFLFHGSCSNSAMWFGDIGILAENYHVFAVDIIGEAGNSEENRLNLSTNEYAVWIEELFDELGVQKAMLIGNSFGGWMSLKFATTFPERVSKLVLIATSGIAPAKLTFVIKSILYVMQGNKGLRKLNKMVYGTNDIPDEVLEVGNMIMENFNPMTGSLPIYIDKQLNKLRMPVMYMAGENDVTVSVDKTTKRIKKLIPHAIINIDENNGHVIYDSVVKIMPFLKIGL